MLLIAPLSILEAGLSQGVGQGHKQFVHDNTAIAVLTKYTS